LKSSFRTGENGETFIAGLNSKLPASMEFIEPLQAVNIHQTPGLKWTSCGKKRPMREKAGEASSYLDVPSSGH